MGRFYQYTNYTQNTIVDGYFKGYPYIGDVFEFIKIYNWNWNMGDKIYAHATSDDESLVLNWDTFTWDVSSREIIIDNIGEESYENFVKDAKCYDIRTKEFSRIRRENKDVIKNIENMTKLLFSSINSSDGEINDEIKEKINKMLLKQDNNES